MRTVFISDKNNEQRRQNVQDETNKVGLAFTFFDAIMALNCQVKCNSTE